MERLSEAEKQELLGKKKQEIFDSIEKLGQTFRKSGEKKSRYRISEKGLIISIYQTDNENPHVESAEITPAENFDPGDYINKDPNNMSEAEKSISTKAKETFRDCHFDIDMEEGKPNNISVERKESEEEKGFGLGAGKYSLEAPAEPLPLDEESKNIGIIILSHALKEIASQEEGINFITSGRVEPETKPEDEISTGTL